MRTSPARQSLPQLMLIPLTDGAVLSITKLGLKLLPSSVPSLATMVHWTVSPPSNPLVRCWLVVPALILLTVQA